MELEVTENPPESLGEHGRKTWTSIYETLAESRLLNNVEYNTLYQYCSISEELLGLESYMIDMKKEEDAETYYRSRVWSRWDKLQDRFWRVVKELGISPGSLPQHSAKKKASGAIETRKR